MRFHSIFKTVVCIAFLVKPYFGSKIAEHGVTMTSFPAGLLQLKKIPLAKMCEIDARRGMESLVTLLASVWELSRKVYRGGGGDSAPRTGRGLTKTYGT